PNSDDPEGRRVDIDPLPRGDRSLQRAEPILKVETAKCEYSSPLRSQRWSANAYVRGSSAPHLNMQSMERVGNTPVASKSSKRALDVSLARELAFWGHLHEMPFDADPPGPVPFEGVIVGLVAFLDGKFSRA